MRARLQLALVTAGLLVQAGCPESPRGVIPPAIPPRVETLSVTTTLDGSDAEAGDGVCEMTPGVGDCSLRAAIDQANASTAKRVVILVQPDVYPLTVPGFDDTNAGGDLDLASRAELIILAPPPGALIAAAGADGGLELHWGFARIEGLGASGAAGAGFAARAGSLLVASRASLFDNGGPGMAIEAGAFGSTGNATVSGNLGGGVAVEGAYRAAYTTITDNGVAGITGRGSAQLEASVVGDQAAGPDCAASLGVRSSGHNLFSDESCGLRGPSDLTATPPRLGGASGAINPVHPPLDDSPLLDSLPFGVGPCTRGSLQSPDEYGTPRPRGSGCDRGAIEGTALPPIVTEPGDGTDAAPGDGVCEVSPMAGDCTLRAAIDEAAAALFTPIIRLVTDVTLALAGDEEDDNESGDLDIGVDLTIVGNGFSVDADGLDRVMQVRAPATLTLEHVTLSGGYAEMGGGLRIDEHAVAIIGRSTIRESEAYGYIACAGAIWDEWFECSDENTEVGNLVLGFHQGEGGGGGIWSRGTLSLRDSTLSGNVTSGRGDCNDFRLGRMCRHHVGGGLLSYGRADLQDVTFSGNLAIRGRGGGLAQVEPGQVTLVHVTLSENTTTEVGHNPLGNGRTIIGNPEIAGSIVSGSTFACTSWDFEDTPAVESLGFNVFSDWSCSRAGVESDLTETEASIALAELADHGGPTLTHRPEPGSPVIDRIPAGALGLCDAGKPADQRGVPRPIGSGCDVGAVEAE